MALVHRVGWEPRFVSRNPWFWPLSRAAARFESASDWPTLHDFDVLHATLTADTGVPALRFGDNVRKQDKRIEGRVNVDALYDARVAKFGEVPSRTRDWHDFFNALCFATFPRAKLALHTRQHTILTQRIAPDATRLPGARTREQDTLTLFDEGGVVIAMDSAAQRGANALDAQTRRDALHTIVPTVATAPTHVVDLWGGRVSIVPFGHALYEHLIEGLRCPGGCMQWLSLPELADDHATRLDAVDRALADRLRDPTCFTDPAQCGGVPLSLHG